MNFEKLLSQVFEINKRYEEIAKHTGEDFNIFNILRLSSDELSHSNVIAALLNPKEKHGKGNTFLKLFMQTLRISEDEFPVKSAKIYTEKSFDNGRVDIIIENEKKRRIFIENKIYAGDQYEQLKRYKKHDPYKLFYLTLDGHDASEESKGDLEEGKDYISISYREEISRWLEECLKESVGFPLLRETVKQYINLIKSLTGQSRSVEMTTEITDLLMKDKENLIGAFKIQSALWSVKKKIISDKLTPQLEELAKKEGLDFIAMAGDGSALWDGFSFKNNDITIRFEFQSKYFVNLVYGFREVKDEKVNNFLRAYAEKNGYSSQWPFYKSMDKYQNWNDWNGDVFIKLMDKDNDVVKTIEEKLKELLGVLQQYNPDAL